jgi:hypothetical protein
MRKFVRWDDDNTITHDRLCVHDDVMAPDDVIIRDDVIALDEYLSPLLAEWIVLPSVGGLTNCISAIFEIKG